MSETTKLLPCPFCGGEPRIAHNSFAETYWVKCATCETRTMEFMEAASAAEWWNRRAALRADAPGGTARDAGRVSGSVRTDAARSHGLTIRGTPAAAPPIRVREGEDGGTDDTKRLRGAFVDGTLWQRKWQESMPQAPYSYGNAVAASVERFPDAAIAGSETAGREAPSGEKA